MDFSELVTYCHLASVKAGWWIEERTIYFYCTKIALIHSEISEAMEALRKDKMDNHLPNRSGIEVELADAVIRIFDLAGALELDLESALLEKMEYNKSRSDHKFEVRSSTEGKRF